LTPTSTPTPTVAVVFDEWESETVGMFDSPEAASDWIGLQSDGPAGRYGISVSDDACPSCHRLMSREAWHDCAGGWCCPNCGEVDRRDKRLVDVHFKWSDQFGACYECGLPAAFARSYHYTPSHLPVWPRECADNMKLCAVCAANAAANNEAIVRIEEKWYDAETEEIPRTTTFEVDFVDASPTVTGMYGALVDRVVDFKLTNDGYPHENVYVLRVDGDGDVVVCELGDDGVPVTNSTWAIPQDVIRHVVVKLGDAA
jgi:hypothetical protein